MPIQRRVCLCILYVRMRTVSLVLRMSRRGVCDERMHCATLPLLKITRASDTQKMLARGGAARR